MVKTKTIKCTLSYTITGIGFTDEQAEDMLNEAAIALMDAAGDKGMELTLSNPGIVIKEDGYKDRYVK